MTNVIDWTERKRIGDQHEARVRRELERRGWTVAPYGQGMLPEPIRRVLRSTDSAMRWDPDMVASLGSSLCMIDGKAAMRGEAARRYSISRRALRAHLQMWALNLIPIYYVFSNLTVATAYEVMQYDPAATLGRTEGYVSLPAGIPVPFDEVFGSPTPVASVLRAA